MSFLLQQHHTLLSKHDAATSKSIKFSCSAAYRVYYVFLDQTIPELVHGLLPKLPTLLKLYSALYSLLA